VADEGGKRNLLKGESEGKLKEKYQEASGSSRTPNGESVRGPEMRIKVEKARENSILKFGLGGECRKQIGCSRGNPGTLQRDCQGVARDL